MYKLKIGLLGLGVVGSGVPQILTTNKEKIQQVTGTEISVERALVRDDAEKARRSEQFPDVSLTTNVEEIVASDEIDVVVELMGKVEPARTFIKQALANGKHVVTANKDLLAQHGVELVALAKQNHVNLYYEASVAGGIPILRTIANSLASDEITSVLGIVNGTTNYMLTKMMEEGWGYEEALAQAQRLGFAESDPTNDVDGIDAAYKMVILSQFAFGMNVTMDDLKIKGIRGLAAADVEMAAQLGYAVKLIGSSEKTGDSISVEVGPTLVPNTHPLAAVKNEFNAVFVKSTGVGESMYYGPGAGSMPTATSVVADIMVVAKNVAAGVVGQSFNEYTADTKLTPNDQALGKYYFSIEVPDEKGKLLRLIEMMTKAEVDFDKVVQQESDHVKARVVVITHTISKAQMQQVVAAIANEADFELLSTLRVLEA